MNSNFTSIAFSKVTLLFLFLSVHLYGQQYQPEKISTVLLEKIQNRALESHAIFVQAKQQVDVQHLLDSFNIHSVPLEQRAIHTNKSLRKVASESKAQLEYIANDLGLGQVEFYWIINGFTCRATESQVRAITAFEEVSFIDIEHEVEWDEPTDFVMSSELRSNSGSLERDIRIINAPAMWKRGYTGYGRKVFIIDSGVDPAHPALRRNFAGNVIPESQAWYATPTFPRALDCGSHGTHVAGTVLGIDRNLNDTIGVAYNAMWMGSPGLCGPEGGGTFTHLQWALDPDNNPETTDDMPDVINNSWFIRELANECNGSYVHLLTALEAAGIAVVFSAGNAGPNSQTITAPKNINVSLVNSFAVGNLDGRNLNINNGSSRGPSICGGQGSLLIKPEVSAPGTGVRSSVPGGYALFTGTSMAAPHVSGALLLLKEAFPYLSGEELKLSLYFTAIDLGEPGEDNNYGMGLIDVDAAFEYLVGQGYEPVDPEAAYDIAIEEYSHWTDHCTGEVYAIFTLQNAGKQPIHGFEILSFSDATEPETELLYTSYQIIEPNEKIQLQAPFQLKSEERSDLSFLIRLIDQEDEKPLNNQIKFTTRYKPVELIKPVLNETIFEKFVCSGTHFVLKNEDTGTNFLWYQNAEDVLPFLKSNERIIQAPASETTMAFHLGIETVETILAANKTNASIEVLPDFNTGILFSTNHEVVLHHFKINPTTRSFHTIQLTDEDGNVFWEVNRFYSAGEHEIPVNRVLKADRKYFLSNLTNRPVLAFENENRISTRMSDYVNVESMFINNIPESNFLPTMHSFHFSAELPCKRETFEIKVKPLQNTPAADFTLEENEAMILGTPIVFQNLSTNADRVLWNFGNDEFSTEFSPTKTFSEAGTYEVELKVWSGSVCNDIRRKTILVESSTSASNLTASEETKILVYPNPSNGDIFIELEGNMDKQIAKCDIISVNGTILNFQSEWDKTQIMKIQTSHRGLPSGIYSLRLILDDGSVHIRQFTIL